MQSHIVLNSSDLIAVSPDLDLELFGEILFLNFDSNLAIAKLKPFAVSANETEIH